VTLAGAAAAGGVHPAHLAREFRVHYRTSVGSYVRGLRLAWAAQRLAGTNDPIADIAVEAGFADQSHFTRAFRSYSGLTPRAFRETQFTD
jgi:AraC family transcriptional regulator